MSHTIAKIIVLFFFYSILGWLWETIYCSIRQRRFVYRGFLIGPYCPVYGFSVMIVLFIVKPVENHFLFIYIIGVIIATMMEYIGALFLDHFFHLKLWDYSHYWGNIQGRVALAISAFWGFGIVLVTKVIHPFFDIIVNRLPSFLAIIILIILCSDTIWTITETSLFKKIMREWDQQIKREVQKISIDSVKSIRENINKIHSDFDKRFAFYPIRRFRFNQRRLIKNYPRLAFLDFPELEEFKKELLNFKRKK